MRLSIKWLNELVDLSDINTKQLMDDLTMSGSKVETLEVLAEDIDKVVVGKILSVEKHPEADRLVVCSVDVGPEKIQIVTAAKNVVPGMLVPVALDGAHLAGNVTIQSGNLRGVASQGMFCSFAELGLTLHECPYGDPNGILALQKGNPGDDVKEILSMYDSAIEFEITPNRPDCCSIIGLAREAAATYNRKLNLAEPKVIKGTGNISDYLRVGIKAPDLCRRYMARVITDVKVGPSPEWLRMRLWAQGIRAINNIVDITNYVMLEYGQPMHAFDYSCLEGAEISVRCAFNGEVIRTLDEKERVLTDKMLVIADNVKPVAVAGVMGGENSEIKETTKTVVFESANFDGASVRLTSKALGMRTDASSLFEKMLPPENCEGALNRACELIELLGAGKVVGGTIDEYPSPREPRKIRPDFGRINVLLGTKISDYEMLEYFARVGLDLNTDGTLSIPWWRDDIACTADLAEEVARFYGYDKIPTTTFSGHAVPVVLSPEQKLREDLAQCSVGLGFDEILTFTFMSPSNYDKIALTEDSPLRKSLSILNPLGGDEAVMRTTALPGMVSVVASNQKVKVANAKLFEVAKVFKPELKEDGTVDPTKTPTESSVLMLAEYGAGCDFYSLKSAVDAICSYVRGANCKYVACKTNPSYHPGRCAVITCDEKEIGVIGELSFAVSNNYGLQSRVYVAELSVPALLSLERGVPAYKAISKYPSLYRDIAVTCAESVTVGALSDCIRKYGDKLCTDVKLFDIYRGTPIAPGFKSVAFSIVFSDPNRTITDSEADKLFADIVTGLECDCGAKLR